MIREHLTEEEFISKRVKDIFRVNNLFEGVREYKVQDKEDPESLLIYRFRNSKLLGIFDADEDDTDFQYLLSVEETKNIKAIGRFCRFIIYLVLIVNIRHLINMDSDSDYIPILLGAYLYFITKIVTYRIKGFKTIEHVRNTTIVELFNTILIAVAVVLATAGRQHYLIVGFYVMVSLIAIVANVIEITRYTDCKLYTK